MPKPAQAKPMIGNITPDLADKRVPIASLKHDPMNARKHGEENMAAIKRSLELYGQVKPVVVRKETNVVMAGNGTLAAARELGWTHVAATFVSMTNVEAAGYGLADNRTAELAEWDAEVVAKLQMLLEEAGQGVVGWSAEQLAMLRADAADPEDDDTDPQDWKELWEDMPEFLQEDKTSFKRIVVHFRTEADMQDFLRIVGQRPGDVKQHSIWHPKAEIERFADKTYRRTV